MKTNLRTVLVHGMGADPNWWDPVRPGLERAGLRTETPLMPSLEISGPEAWCSALAGAASRPPTLLVGHSLGAAVCVAVARRTGTLGVILLACPPFVDGYRPQAPPASGISQAAVARVADFLTQTLASRTPLLAAAPTLHLVGSQDPWVPVAVARRLPFPLEVLDGAGHGLNRVETLPHRIVEWAARALPRGTL